MWVYETVVTKKKKKILTLPFTMLPTIPKQDPFACYLQVQRTINDPTVQLSGISNVFGCNLFTSN